MTPPDDLDLTFGPDREPPTDGGDGPWGNSVRRGPLVAIAVGIACLAAVVWYLWSPDARPPSTAAQPAGRSDTNVAVRADTPRLGDGDAVDLPPLDALDPLLRAMLGTLSTRPELARLLATDNLIRRFVTAVDSIGRGASPTRQIATLKPAADFSVERPYSESTIQPESHARYTGMVDTIAGLDTSALSRIYAQLRPRLDEAYAELGGPQESFDAAMERALSHLLAVDPALAAGRVRPSGGVTYAWVSDDAERLSAAQKHLLRLGPTGAERVQRKLREVGTALGIPAERLR